MWYRGGEIETVDEPGQDQELEAARAEIVRLRSEVTWYKHTLQEVEQEMCKVRKSARYLIEETRDHRKYLKAIAKEAVDKITPVLRQEAIEALRKERKGKKAEKEAAAPSPSA